MPLWQKVLLAFGFPLVGVGGILLLVASGQYTIDGKFFLANLPKVLLGTVAFGLGASMLWLRFGPSGTTLNKSSRIAAIILGLAALVAGFYIVAPPTWTKPVDGLFLWLGKLVGSWMK